MKKSKIYIYTLMLIAILFFMILCRYVNLTRNQIKSVNQEISFDYLLDSYPSNCIYQGTNGYQFRLPACTQLPIGEYYTIIGIVRPLADKVNNHYYNIDVSEIIPYSHSCCSLNFFIVTLYQKLLDWTVKIRITLKYFLARFLPQENANLILGLVLGSGMAEFTSGFKTVIKQLGLSHMVAVSGFHLGVLFVFTSGVFNSFFSRKLSVLATIIFLAWYTLLVSTPLSLLRAMFMLILSLIGRNYFYKYTNSFLILLQVLLLMSLLSVLNVFNVGMQLSFLSTAGILLFASSFSHPSETFGLALHGKQWKKLLSHLVALIKASILTSLSAQLMSLPVMINTFGELAPLGFVSTLVFSSLLTFLVSLSVPLLTFSIITRACNFAFYLIGPLYVFLSDLSTICLRLLTWSTHWIGYLVPVRFSLGWKEIFIYYGLILSFVWFSHRARRRSLVYVI